MALFWKRKTEKSESMTAQTLLDFLGVSTTDGTKLSESTYFACLKILGETLGKLPLKLQQHTDKNGVIKAYKHPLYSVLGSRPNPHMTATHFWSTVEYNRNHHGNAYVWITGAGQKTKLWILPSEAVKVWVDSGGVRGVNNAIWYVYTHNGEQYKIPSESMLHFRSSTSFDGITGKSVREILADTLTDEQGLELIALFEPWALKAYAVGDRVRRDGKLYKCLLAHTSQDDWAPDAASSLWVSVSDPAEEWPAWSQPVGAQDAYSSGAKVSHNGKRWTSAYAANVWEPGVYGWTEVTGA